MTSSLTVVEQDGEVSLPLIAALSAAVYPSDVLASVPWRSIQSARSQHRILVLDHQSIVVGAAGLLVRGALLDGQSVQIAGVGGVMTMPARQGTGIGRIAMEAVDRVAWRFSQVQFGLLFCEPNNVGFYNKLGWHRFSGIVEAQQASGKQVYDIMQTMVRPVHGEAPVQGRIDLCGLPW